MLPSSVAQHRSDADKSIGVSVLTVSDTRTLETDLGGKTIEESCIQAGFQMIERRIVVDEADKIRDAVTDMLTSQTCNAVLVTGGTGLASRDVTVDAVESLYDSAIPGYGELFRMLSYQEIGAAAMLSRASGGRIGKKIVLTMPGSVAGVRLALEKLIVPELAHLVHHTGK